MTHKHSRLKRKPTIVLSLPHKIMVDVLGIFLIILAGLIGWLPGPGGIPLFLAGLSLLATNHKWARKLLHTTKNKGIKLVDIVFRKHPILVIGYDILALILLILAGLLFGKASGNIWRGLAVSLLFLGIGLLLGNRQRINSLNNLINSLIKRSKS